MNTTLEIGKGQGNDIERYLKKECRVMDDIIVKQQKKQKAEYAKINNGVHDVCNIIVELD